MTSPRRGRRWLPAAAFLLCAGCGLAPAPPSDTLTSAPTGLTSDARGLTHSPTGVQIRGFTAAEQAALRVRNIGCDGVSLGSGFAISNHMFITNRHVVGGAALLQVSTYDGRDIDVTTTGAANIADLAVVRTVETLPATIPLAEANPPTGTPVTAIGFPLGGPLSTTHGKVLGYAKDPVGWSKLPMLLNDAPIEHGSSGSALLDNDGKLVGVVYATSGAVKQYAVPIEVLKDLLNGSAGISATGECGGQPDQGRSPSDTTTRCSATVSVGPATSCPFGLKVASAWRAAGGGAVMVTATSPVTHKTYSMRCVDGDPVICTGGNDAVVYVSE